MTLIVGIKCGDSAVLCADSQETLSDGQKTERNKLEISSAVGDRFDVVVGGAGIVPLSDVLRSRILERFEKIRDSTAVAVLSAVRDAIAQFHRAHEYTAFHGKPEDKYLSGLIAIRLIESGKCLLLKYFSSVVEPVNDYSLAGEERASYEIIAKRGYKASLSIDQAIVHSVNIVAEAKRTSQYVGGQIRVVQVQHEAVTEVDSGKIYKIELHVGEANRLMTELMWQAADQSISRKDYQKNLSLFCNSMTAARGIYGVSLPPWPSATLGQSDDESTE
jgi:ATP-dependent protease HslVU (ClpYQ) peptidase subunit